MTMPDFTLNDHIGWVTTRRIQLCSQAVTELNTIISGSFQSFSAKLAGINTSNSLAYIQPLNDISNNENFYEDAQEVIIPHNLLNFIEFDYLPNNANFTDGMITDLLEAVGLTPEFSDFLAALNGITPENCQDSQYRSVIEYNLMYCPKFLYDTMSYSV